MSRDRDRREARVNPGIPVPTAPEAEPGPAPEKWAYAPGVSPEDIAAAVEWCRAHNSSSPLHMVAAHIMIERTRPDLDEESRRALWRHTLAEARSAANPTL